MQVENSYWMHQRVISQAYTVIWIFIIIFLLKQLHKQDSHFDCFVNAAHIYFTFAYIQ